MDLGVTGMLQRWQLHCVGVWKDVRDRRLSEWAPCVFAEHLRAQGRKLQQVLVLWTQLPLWQRVKQTAMLGVGGSLTMAEGLCAQLHMCYFVSSSSPSTTEDAGSLHPPVLRLSSEIINLFLICSCMWFMSVHPWAVKAIKHKLSAVLQFPDLLSSVHLISVCAPEVCRCWEKCIQPSKKGQKHLYSVPRPLNF